MDEGGQQKNRTEAIEIAAMGRHATPKSVLCGEDFAAVLDAEDTLERAAENVCCDYYDGGKQNE